jgi:hypothetical protein
MTQIKQFDNTNMIPESLLVSVSALFELRELYVVIELIKLHYDLVLFPFLEAVAKMMSMSLSIFLVTAMFPFHAIVMCIVGGGGITNCYEQNSLFNSTPGQNISGSVLDMNAMLSQSMFDLINSQILQPLGFGSQITFSANSTANCSNSESGYFH